MYKAFKSVDGFWYVSKNPEVLKDTLCRCKTENDALFISVRLNLAEDCAGRLLDIRVLLDKPYLQDK